MTHALISFLGRTPRNQINGYRTTIYKFPDGHESETAFLGWDLARRLKPDLVIVLGTSGSMWDFLAESVGIDKPVLVNVVESQTVSKEHLQDISPLIADQLDIKTQLHLIPKGLKETEQLNVLHTMAEATKGVDELTLDVSHAFRHLPMIAIVAGVYLQAVRNVTLRALYYGFYDPDTQKGTVYDLKGLLHLFDWVRALSQYEHTGDYGVFAELLPTENSDLADLMHKAAFFERISPEHLAQQKVCEIYSTLDSTPLTGVASLFQSALQDRLAWSRKRTPQHRQHLLAKDYLKRRDYLRATLYALEAFVTYLVSKRGGNPASYKDRNEAKNEYEQGNMSSSYRNLRELRNAMAHGTGPSSKKIKQVIKKEEELKDQIKQFLENWNRGKL